MRNQSQLAVCISILGLLGVAAAGCNGVDDNQKQLADYTGQAQVDATNQDQVAKAQAMEADLATRQRFFQGVSGTYEGALSKADGASQNLDNRFIISASVPPYHSERVRSLEEITADLENLHLNVQVVQWDADTGATFGCIFTGIQPDLNSGHIVLIASDCPNSYSLWLAPSTGSVAGVPGGVVSGNSSSIAQGLLGANAEQAGALDVEMDPTHTPDALHFIVKRVSSR